MSRAALARALRRLADVWAWPSGQLRRWSWRISPYVEPVPTESVDIDENGDGPATRIAKWDVRRMRAFGSSITVGRGLRRAFPRLTTEQLIAISETNSVLAYDEPNLPADTSADRTT